MALGMALEMAVVGGACRQADLCWQRMGEAPGKTPMTTDAEGAREAPLAEQAPPTVIVCAGLPRSGSTWLYNAARLTLEHVGLGPVYGAWVDDYDPAGDRGAAARAHLVKVHDFATDLAGRAEVVIASVRDLPAIAASMRRMGFVKSDDELEQGIAGAIDAFEAWAGVAGYVMRYETMTADRPAEVIRLAAAYDPVSLLHPRHVSTPDDAQASVAPDVIEAINARFADWRARHDYR